MSHRSILISVILSILLLSFTVHSQEVRPIPVSDETAAVELNKKALESLNAVSAQVNTLHSPENRARIGSNLAEVLWNHDEKRSRSLFATVGDDINEGVTNSDPNTDVRNHAQRVFRQLRVDTVTRIARHDPVLALEFLRTTRPPVNAHPDDESPYSEKYLEKTLELRLAGQIAAKNPELGLKLGRESLAYGLSDDLLSVLSQLRLNDKKASLTLYKEIVDKLKGMKLSEDWEASAIALNLARSFRPPEADEEVYKDLMGILLSTALASGCVDAEPDDAPQICREIGSMFSTINKYYAPRAVPLKRWAETANAQSAQSEIWAEVQEASEKGSVDEILELAKKHPDLQYQLYSAAIGRAKVSGDFARARQIASDFPYVSERNEILAQVIVDEKRSAMNPADPATMQRGLSSFRTDEERIEYLLRAASRLAESDHKSALRLLNEADQLIVSTKPGRIQIQAQLALAFLYCSLKSDRGFGIMESLMPKLNELVSSAAALNGFENNYLSEGEWNMTGEGVIGALLTALANNAGYFARLDFDRAVILTNQLERPELRLMGQLKLAQSILSGEPNPPIFQIPSSVP